MDGARLFQIKTAFPAAGAIRASQARSHCQVAWDVCHAIALMSLRFIPRSDRSLSLRRSSSRTVLRKRNHARILERTNEINIGRVLLSGTINRGRSVPLSQVGVTTRSVGLHLTRLSPDSASKANEGQEDHHVACRGK